MTIRRDLDELAQQGVLRRVRGGALSLLLLGEEPPFAAREREAVEAKRRIGAAAADLLVDGEAVLLDAGTTTLESAACSPIWSSARWSPSPRWPRWCSC